jgi:hypothetical protein
MPPTFGGGEIHLFGSFRFEEGAHGGLLGEVEFGVRAGDQSRSAALLQAADDGGADHAAVAGDVDSGWRHDLLIRCGRRS